MKTKWFPPDKEPLCDAVLSTNNGKKYWRSWDSAAPGWWERTVRELGVKKWRKVFKKDQQ